MTAVPTGSLSKSSNNRNSRFRRFAKLIDLLSTVHTIYIALFPQLVAGPIVRYSTIASEIKCRNESIYGASAGFQRLLFGLGKKVLIANQVGLLADTVFKQGEEYLSTGLVWLGILAYSFQIYFDFSGYSDIAIGLGEIFGFHFLENFDYPYISISITEFWHRWHISLSTWFQDYVYIPLGGNRVAKKRHILNLLIVWSLTGIWHGAAWNFLIWGLYYGVLLVAEKYLLRDYLTRLPKLLCHFYAIFFIIFDIIPKVLSRTILRSTSRIL